MHILFIDWPCFGKSDAVLAFEQMGYQLKMFFHKDYQERISPDFNQAFDEAVKTNKFKFCFSFNYYPVVAEGCKRNEIPYIALVYDSPYVPLYSYTMIYPTNHVFLFDKQEYLKLRNIGIPTVYYSPLPVNASAIDLLAKNRFDRRKCTCDISFVGALYNEAHNFYDRLAGVNDYTRGYLDAVIEAQLKIYGYNFLEEILTQDIIQELLRVSPYSNDKYGVETPAYIYANYYLGRKITSLERIRLLTAIGERFPEKLKLFTLNRQLHIPHVQNMGTADYFNEMPHVFANSKINLNITLKSIQSGIPLRAMDIMGAGGFLLTNFQADFLDYFIPGEDFVYYNDSDDLLNKIEYYLSHEKERQEIAQNGHQKVKENHSFQKCFENMLETLKQ
ncbi:MAG: glycosyltransferase [Lachnospiraceae bacterium]|nr:glycosyltransferase [Lachnospiraceae bacterium]